MTVVSEEHLIQMADRHRKLTEKLEALQAKFAGASAHDERDAHVARDNLSEAMQMIQSLQSHLEETEAELSQKTSILRSYNREESTARIEARIAEVRDVERAAVAKELNDLRGENARLHSENDELRASKKKLREALERLKDQRA
jgi:chromosome segregation ATPase